MIDIASLDETQLGGTMRLIRAGILARGWRATVPYAKSPHVFIDRGDGKQLHIYSATPPTTSYAAAALANDKFASYHQLISAGLPQLETALVIDDKQAAIELLYRVGTVVVKPIDGGHGKGITVGVETDQQLEAAIEHALLHTHSNRKVIVQEQFHHAAIRDIRVVCINYTYVAALMRVPARVFGDAEHTVEQLIAAENQSPRRGEPYHAPLATIDTGRAAQFLGQRMQDVPGRGEEVWVLGVANYGAGGELVDLTNDMPAWLIEQAVHASRISGLPVAGVDFMMSDIPSSTMLPEDVEAVIVEINKCPALAIHDEPTFGKPRGAVAAYIEYLATL